MEIKKTLEEKIQDLDRYEDMIQKYGELTKHAPDLYHLSKEVRAQYLFLENQRLLDDKLSERFRAISYSIGTLGGDSFEISLRTRNGDNYFIIITRVEVVELIHKLSASIGCHLSIAPREDFASFRGWKTDDDGSYRPLGFVKEENKKLTLSNQGESFEKISDNDT